MNKIVVAIIAILIIGGGGYFYLTNRNTLAPQTQTPVGQTQVSPTTAQISPTITENLITLTLNGYTPSTLTIKVGTTVTWMNNSGDVATVSSDPHPTHTDYKPLNLGRFLNGERLTLTFDKIGTYKYHNHLNASQKGTIIVE